MSSANSPYSILLASVLADHLVLLDGRLGELVREEIDEVSQLVISFLSQPISPATCFQFATRLQQILRELGRKILEFTCNECEPESAEDAPHDTTYEGGGYRRINNKTPNKFVDTTFGRIVIWRRGYRYWHRGQNESNIFPLELILGLLHGATPALAGEISRMMAESGATQNRVLEQAKRHFNVSLSVERLRNLVEAVSESMERFRQHHQVLKLLELLEQAYQSRGRHLYASCCWWRVSTGRGSHGGHLRSAGSTFGDRLPGVGTRVRTTQAYRATDGID